MNQFKNGFLIALGGLAAIAAVRWAQSLRAPAAGGGAAVSEDLLAAELQEDLLAAELQPATAADGSAAASSLFGLLDGLRFGGREIILGINPPSDRQTAVMDGGPLLGGVYDPGVSSLRFELPASWGRYRFGINPPSRGVVGVGGGASDTAGIYVAPGGSVAVTGSAWSGGRSRTVGI